MGIRVGVALMLLSRLAGAEAPHKVERLAESLLGEGDRFLQARDSGSAIAMFEAARVLADDRPGPHLMLGLAYAQSDACDKALVHLERYLALKKSEPRHEATTTLAACQVSERARVQRKADEERAAAEAEQRSRSQSSEVGQRLERALRMIADEQDRSRRLEQQLQGAESNARTPPLALLNHPTLVRNVGSRVFIEWALTFYISPEGRASVRDFSYKQDGNGYLIESGGEFDAGSGIATIMRVEQPGGTRSITWYTMGSSPLLNQRW